MTDSDQPDPPKPTPVYISVQPGVPVAVTIGDKLLSADDAATFLAQMEAAAKGLPEA